MLPLEDLYNIRETSRKFSEMLVDSGISSVNKVFIVSKPDMDESPVHGDWTRTFWDKKRTKLSLVSEVKFDIEACRGLLTRPSRHGPEEVLSELICSLVDSYPKFCKRRISVESRSI